MDNHRQNTQGNYSTTIAVCIWDECFFFSMKDKWLCSVTQIRLDISPSYSAFFSLWASPDSHLLNQYERLWALIIQTKSFKNKAPYNITDNVRSVIWITMKCKICKPALWPKAAEDVTLSLEWLIFLCPLSFFSPTKCVCSSFGLTPAAGLLRFQL